MPFLPVRRHALAMLQSPHEKHVASAIDRSLRIAPQSLHPNGRGRTSILRMGARLSSSGRDIPGRLHSTSTRPCPAPGPGSERSLPLLAHVPALLAPQEPRVRAGEAPISRRPVIVPDRPLERAGALHERLHASPKTISAAGMWLGFPPPAVTASPRSSMSRRVPDSRVSLLPNAESFMCVWMRMWVWRSCRRGITRPYPLRVPVPVCNDIVSRPPTTLVEAPAIPLHGIARQPRQRSPTAPAVASCDAGDGAKV